MKTEEEPPDSRSKEIFIKGVKHLTRFFPRSEFERIIASGDALHRVCSGEIVSLDDDVRSREDYKRLHHICFTLFTDGLRRSGYTTTNGESCKIGQYFEGFFNGFYSELKGIDSGDRAQK